MTIPDGILCSKTHEWIVEVDNQYIIGLTDIALERLSEIISIELPEIGSYYSKGETFGTIESIKIASELYMPVGGEIIEINTELINSPELINEDPFDAWLIKIKPEDFQKESQNLMDYNDYKDEV